MAESQIKLIKNTELVLFKNIANYRKSSIIQNKKYIRRENQRNEVQMRKSIY